MTTEWMFTVSSSVHWTGLFYFLDLLAGPDKRGKVTEKRGVCPEKKVEVTDKSESPDKG